MNRAHPTLAEAPRCVWKADRTLGEGAWWSDTDQALYWVDIKDPAILRLNVPSGERSIWPLPEPIGCCTPGPDGTLIVALASGIYVVTLGEPGTSPALRLICRPDEMTVGDRMNDGQCHPDGSFWFGSMDDAEEETRGYFFRLNPELSYSVVAGPYKVCNGPAFSPDGRFAYLSDSAAQIIHRLDLTRLGAKPHVWRHFKQAEGYPDGLTVDSAGRLWVAFWDGAKVSCLEPEHGVVLLEIALPALRPTSCAFGGARLDTLYITSARKHDDPADAGHGGNLFAVRIDGASGIATRRFEGTLRTFASPHIEMI